MSDKTITPGPWLAPCSYGVSRFEVQGDGHRVAVVDRVEDARAISAVPDMLAALIVAREFMSIDRNALADCAIDFDGRMSDDDAAAVADYDKALLQIDAAIQKTTTGSAA